MLKGDAEGFCDGFDVEISIDTEEPPDEITTLIRLARQMCFTEKALVGSTAIKVVERINGLVMEM